MAGIGNLGVINARAHACHAVHRNTPLHSTGQRIPPAPAHYPLSYGSLLYSPTLLHNKA